MILIQVIDRKCPYDRGVCAVGTGDVIVESDRKKRICRFCHLCDLSEKSTVVPTYPSTTLHRGIDQHQNRHVASPRLCRRE
jgi:hypothetical protein